jgi:integrase
MISTRRIFARQTHTPPAWMMMRAPTEILFSSWVTLTEHYWVTFRERRSRLLGSPAETWLFGSEKGTPMRRDNIWRKCMYPKLKPVGLEWATFQVMRRTFATLSKAAGVDAHTRSAQMGNTVDVNENEYAVASFEQKLAGVRKLESVVIQ